SEIKIKLQEYLPNYMIPAHFVTLDQFPQTRTGKIDKKLLPDPELADVETEFIAASTEVEMELVRHFAKVLDREPETIGIQDNFFRLGGNSLKMNQVLNKIRESFQIDLKVELFFNSPTVEYLALHIENLQSLQNNKVVTEKSKIVI
ncbi:MAG: phosphopantetheine-binding protein, partial [Bacteroidota bacterium]